MEHPEKESRHVLGKLDVHGLLALAVLWGPLC